MKNHRKCGYLHKTDKKYAWVLHCDEFCDIIRKNVTKGENMKKIMCFAKTTLLAVLTLVVALSSTACTGNEADTTSGDTSYDSTTVPEDTTAGAEETIDEHTYDFYVTLGTMPTLYATLNAYGRQNPNTYMWFLRGNTISYDYSADFIHYFENQSKTNATSEIDYSLIRAKVKEIYENDKDAKFNFYCDDLRVSLIAHIFVYAGVDFENMHVTLLSDGTGTYNNFNAQTDDYYASYSVRWNDTVKKYTDGRNTQDFEAPFSDDGTAMDLQYLAFYMSTFDNVEYWIQSPEYLVCDSNTVKEARSEMHIVKKDPKEMYGSLDDGIKNDYKKAVLANALVDSETLKTLDDAKEYFDTKLSGRDKDIVLILGTNKQTLEENKTYIDQTVEFYTPTLNADTETANYKGQNYSVTDNKITVDGKQLEVGKLGVYLFFKGHPAYPANDELMSYFETNGIEVLPHRTPVETLFWLYDVKVGGYESTSYLSCYKGQTEFMYEEPKAEAIVQMMKAGFFENAAIFKAEN